MDIVSWLLSRKYTDMSIVGLGSIRGANCTIDNIVHQDGINTVTFKWTGTDGTEKTRDMVVYDGTPIYVWESGNTYHYGDLAIYESQFYRCIVENNDVTFDSTKWNEIGSPDGNYDIVQSVNLLPARFTAADRKLYYVIDENCFYLWNGTAWVKTISNKIADLDDVNLDDLTEGDVLVWDSVNEKWVNKAKFDEYKTAFTGTEEEWNALTPEEQNAYDIINITNDGDVLNLGIYLEKTTAMPVASEDVANRIYLYTGTTTQNYKKGVVYQCVSDGQDPATYSWVALIDFGTASIKNSTDRVLPNSTDLVESRAVYSAINTALSSIYTPRGNITCAKLTSALLISDNIGSVYETSDSGTTTALFLQGAGHPIAVGSNVGVINAGQDRILFNLMPNAFDLTDYQKKDLTQAIEGQTTVEGALGALSNNKQPKTLTTSVESQTTVEGALGALSTNKATQAEVNDIVNVLGAKNLLPYPYDQTTKTVNGVTFTDNGDGSITLNGTNTATNTVFMFHQRTESKTAELFSRLKKMNTSFKLLGGINSPIVWLVLDFYDSSGTYISSIMNRSDTPAQFTIPSNAENINLFIRCGVDAVYSNLTIYPMLYLASITDDTYEPYAKGNQELTKDTIGLIDNQNINGAVNILPNTATTQTIYGITFTVNDDGTVTANGTASGGNAAIVINQTDYLKKGNYTLSGAPSGYRISILRGASSTIVDDGDGADFSLTADATQALYVIAVVWEGQTVSNLTFKPMITVASYNGDYVPYAKSNKELTDDVSDIAYESLTDYGSSEYTLTEGKMWQTKGVTFLYVAVTCTTVSPIENGNHIQIATIPSKFKKPQFNMYPTICNYRDGSSHIGAQLQVQNNGTIAIRGGEAGARYCGLFSY